MSDLTVFLKAFSLTHLCLPFLCSLPPAQPFPPLHLGLLVLCTGAPAASLSGSLLLSLHPRSKQGQEKAIL